MLVSSNHFNEKDVSTTLASRLARQGTDPWFLVIDQFEEIFTHYPERWQEREPFFREMQELFREDEGVRVLFVVREDYLAEVDRFGRWLPNGFEIRYRLAGLRRPEALRAIGEPAKKSGDKSRAEKIAALSGALLDNLLTIPVQTRTGVKRVKGEFIEPVHLQVVCRDLWDRLETGPAISGSDLADVDRVLEDYYDRALRKVARRNPVLRWRARRWFERALITSAGTRGIVYMDEDKHSAAGMPDRVVRIFEDERLVRPERRGGAPWYELTHDRLIGPIRNSNGKNRRKTIT